MRDAVVDHPIQWHHNNTGHDTGSLVMLRIADGRSTASASRSSQTQRKMLRTRSSLANPTLTDSGYRTAIRPNLVKSNRTLTPGVSCVVTNVLIPQIRSTSSWDGSAASKYRPIVSFTRRIADHVDGWVTNESGSAYGCGTRAPANPSASR
jgi:hypothetical protein